ncbi:MAG: hypothetical protein M1835_002366 [Candelina submexicana]|nr:MAG: hypothetical protein M1835_002366 [Candelina submexicana]
MLFSGLLVVLLNALLVSPARTVGFTDTSPPSRITDGEPNPSVACSPAYGHPKAEDCSGAAMRLVSALGASMAPDAMTQRPTVFVEPKEFMFFDVAQRFPWAEPVRVPMAFRVGTPLILSNTDEVSDQPLLGIWDNSPARNVDTNRDCYAVLNIVDDIWTVPTDVSCPFDVITATKPVMNTCVKGIGMGGMQRTGEENRLGVAFYGTDSTLREAQLLNRWCTKTKADSRCEIQGKLPATGPGSSGSPGSTNGVAKTCNGWATKGSDCCQGSTFNPVPVAAPLRALMLGIQQALVAGASETIGWCTDVGS